MTMHAAADVPEPTDAAVVRNLRGLRESPEILAAITAARASGEPELALQKRLRQSFPDELIRAGLRLLDARRRAAGKFTRSDQMWLDRVGLEQATAEEIARYKARRFSGEVDDLCCGIGSDATALAGRCAVTAVDRRESMCLMTRWNAEVYGVGERVSTLRADVSSLPATARAVHIDPDRRSGSPGRSRRLEDYRPDLAFLQSLIRTRPGGAIKVGPASNFGGKFPGCEIELISLRGECKEATVWFGELAGESPRRATVLPEGASLAGDPLQHEAPLTPAGPYVFDPDPAVVRSGLLDALAEQLDLARLDEADEYLTGPQPVDSPFVQTFELIAELPNNDRQIREFFRSGDYGEVEIKCRHVRVDAEKVRRKLPLPGEEPAAVIFARVGGRTRALVCRRVHHR